MDPRIFAVPTIMLVLSLSVHGLAGAQQDNATQATTCSQDDIKNAKDGLSSTREKMTHLRAEYYSDWKAARDLGQYNGTLEQYTNEKPGVSQEVAQIKSDYMKFSSILSGCGAMQQQYLPGIAQVPQGTDCGNSAISHARQELATTQRQYSNLQAKAYHDFQQEYASGDYNGTWKDYAHDNLINLPEISQIRSTHDKFAGFLSHCLGRTSQHEPSPSGMLPYMPQDANDSAASAPQPVQQDVHSTINPSDALAAAAGQGIPAWVRGIAGWWAEGKISDGDFVSAIKFLVQQGIIKV